MRTEQSERVRLAESRPCRDGDVYPIRRIKPAYPDLNDFDVVKAYNAEGRLIWAGRPRDFPTGDAA